MEEAFGGNDTSNEAAEDVHKLKEEFALLKIQV
jgi:hypothetical protein